MNTVYSLSSIRKVLHKNTYMMAERLVQHNLLYFVEALFILLKGMLSCVSAIAFFIVLIASKYLPLGAIPRYDFILIMALFVQILLLVAKQETLDDLKAICCFHVLGLILEIFKCHPAIGSWSYPEFAYTKFLGVPLYAGFMHAAVASFILHFWRRSDLVLENYQYPFVVMVLAALIYINFFTHHFIGDYRGILIFFLAIVLWRVRLCFRLYQVRYRLPLLVGFLLLGVLIWVAENIATFYSAWQYPNQQQAWQLVHLGKVNSWGLLVVITFVIVSRFKLKQTTTNRLTL